MFVKVIPPTHPLRRGTQSVVVEHLFSSRVVFLGHTPIWPRLGRLCSVRLDADKQNNEQDDEFGLDEDDERGVGQRARRSGKPLTGKLKKGEKDPW